MADREVYFAKITRAQIGLLDRSFNEDLLSALDPHLEVTRYQRRWKLSRPREEGEFIVGKLGFVRTSSAAETRYDDELEDFVTGTALANEGSFSMFTIDPQTEIMAFESRPPAIEPTSFLGAFRLLLRKSDFRATVTLVKDPTEFREFVQSVDRIQRIRAVVFVPNPRFVPKARNFEQVIEESNAERAEVVAVAPRGGSLNPEAEWVEGALVQIAEHGRGTLKATGTREGRKRVWTFGARVQIAVLSEQEGTTPEDVWDWMRRKLRELFGG